MRTETEIHKREVLAVWIKSCMSHVQDDYKVTASIKQTDMGKNAENVTFCLLPVMLLTLLKGSTIFEEAVLLSF